MSELPAWLISTLWKVVESISVTSSNPFPLQRIPSAEVDQEEQTRASPKHLLCHIQIQRGKMQIRAYISILITCIHDYVYLHPQVTGWLAKEVLSPEHPRKRCALVQYLIEVAKHCLKLGNFVTVFQITSALCSSSIQRLKKTWDHLPHSVS